MFDNYDFPHIGKVKLAVVPTGVAAGASAAGVGATAPVAAAEEKKRKYYFLH